MKVSLHENFQIYGIVYIYTVLVLAVPSRMPITTGFDTLGTIIANIGAESRGNMMTSGELSHVFHLVRTEADEGDDVEKRGGKIMSEVFLTRLLSTKVSSHYNTCTCIVTLSYSH